ncbi:MAG: GHKL domain-containing protein [Anaerolineae bacterium]|nr:GHKL domain-containing protein [Anaerolineae bacterium]
MQEIIDQLFAAETRVHDGEFAIRVADGSQRIWDFSSAPLGRLPDGRRLVMSMASDITQRKAQEREREALIKDLEARTAELERFTYTVSHDLKSPLITIQGYVGLLQKDLEAAAKERIQEDLREISHATEQMQDLLGDLLELSRIGRLVNPPEEVPVAELVQEARRRVAGYLHDREVNFHIQPDLPSVYGDRARLVEVFQNLLDNAIKFSPQIGQTRIEMGIIQKEGQQIFFVRDNGIGIPPDYHEKIFGLFERLDPHIEGTGIGLTLVRRIIEFHGGHIWVESDGPGQGSIFFFTLPQTEGPP